MAKKVFFVFIICSFASVTAFKSNASAPLHGTGWVKTDFTYTIQKPWNVGLYERYSYNPVNNEHRFWVFKDDEPFKNGDTTAPRCEMRIYNNYSSGNHQFEADFYAVEGSNRPCVMQIWPNFMLKISGDEPGGSYWWHQSTELEKNVYGRWVHVNIVHMSTEKKVYVYMDGELAAKVNDNITTETYFKCGIYTCRSEKSEVWIRNINYYIQSDATGIAANDSAEETIQLSGNTVRILFEGETDTGIYNVKGELITSSKEKEIQINGKGFFIVKSARLSGENETVIKKVYMH